MKKADKGFTLLEAVIALVLFALLLQSLLDFFSQMYINARRFEQRSYLVDNARSVNDFIQEKIRNSYFIEVTVATGDNGTPEVLSDDPIVIITPIINSSDNVAYEGRFVQIKMKDKAGTNLSEVNIERIPDSVEGKGKYRLIYTAGGTSSLISDMVENIKVKREIDSDVVEFTCSFNKRDETIDKLKIEEIFTETLAYKNKY